MATLIIVQNPFDRTGRITVEVPAGITAAELIRCYVDEGVECTLAINGAPVSSDLWGSTVITAADSIVLAAVVADGALSALANIGRWLATAFVTALAYSPMTGFYGLWGSSVGGPSVTDITNLINGVPKVPKLDFGQSQAYGWNPQTTQRYGDRLPRIYGTMRVKSNNIISAYIDTDGDNQYANALICFGYGPIQGFRDITINDQPADQLSGVVIETRTGQLRQPVIANFDDTKLEYAMMVKVVNPTPYIYTTVGDAFDGLEVEVVFPEGIWRINDDGKTRGLTVSWRVEARKEGDAEWTAVSSRVTGAAWTAMSGRWSAGRWLQDDRGRWCWQEAAAGTSVRYAHQEGDAYGDTWELYRWRWVTESSTFKVTSINDYHTLSTEKMTPIRRVTRFSVPVAGRYEVRISNLSADQTSEKYGDDLYLVAVREVVRDDFTYPRHALVSVKAKATNQLSGSLRVAATVDGALGRVWNGAAWSVEHTANNAWVCWDILTQPVFNNDLTVARYDGVDPSRLDLADWLVWAEACDQQVSDGNGGYEPRYSFHGIFDATGNAWEAALKVAEMGGARLLRRGTKIAVRVLTDRTAVQTFTVGNIGYDSFSMEYLGMADRIAAYEGRFLNSAKDYEADVYTLVDPDMPVTNRKQIDLFGVVTPSAAWRALKRRLVANRYIIRRARLTVALEGLAAEVGDVVDIQHDVPKYGLAGGRLVAGAAASVTLDRTVTLEAGKTYQIIVVTATGARQARTVTNAAGSWTAITVSPVFSPAPAQYDVYAIGETGKVVKPFEVIDIEPTSELDHTLVLAEYIAGVWTADLDHEPVISVPEYVTSTQYPPVTDITLTEILEKRPDGTIDNYIIANWRRPAAAEYLEAEVWCFTDETQWRKIDRTTAEETRFLARDPGINYTVAVVTVNTLGRIMSLHNAPTADIVPLGKTAPPADVSTAGADVVRGQMRIYWEPVADVDLSGYDLQLGTEWDAAGNSRLLTNYGGTSYPWTPDQTGLISILIKARDTSGNLSVNAYRLDYQVKAPGKCIITSAKVIDNFVELAWQPGTVGTFPLSHYAIYSGADFATAAYRGRADVNTTVLMEDTAGTYKYWLVPVDIAGLSGTENGIYVSITAPPDFTLIANASLDFATCTLTNAVVENGEIVLPIDATETFEGHFTSNAWDQPQDQIDAGLPVFVQPGEATGQVQKIIDLGAVISAAQITLEVTRQTVVGTVTVAPQLSVSSDGSTWGGAVSAYDLYGQSFRYIKIVLACSTADSGILRIQRMDYRVRVKERMARTVVNIADTTGTGTEVTFASMGITPADVVGIFPSPPYTGTTSDPVKVLVNFTDVANPTSFRLVAYDKNNARMAVNNVAVLVRYI